MQQQERVTQLLIEVTEGRQGAVNELVPLIYDELRALARQHLRRERADHTLNTTALVHEAYLKLVKLERMQWESRAHFVAIASQAMRNILVSYATRRKALKRGGGQERVSFDEDDFLPEERAEEILALDAALKRLAAMHERQARIVECRFFGGLEIKETAVVLGISPATVKRDWTVARAWLDRALREELS